MTGEAHRASGDQLPADAGAGNIARNDVGASLPTSHLSAQCSKLTYQMVGEKRFPVNRILHIFGEKMRYWPKIMNPWRNPSCC
jgi:hypothetical protein